MAAARPGVVVASISVTIRTSVVAASAIRVVVWTSRSRSVASAPVRFAIVASTTFGPARKRPTCGQQTPTTPERQVIQHIVLFTPKAALSDLDRRSFARTTINTLASSQDISRLTLGRRAEIDAGYERLFGDKTYEYAAVLEFVDRAGLVRYLNSAEHAELGRLFWQHCESTVVCEVEVVDCAAADAIDRLV